MMCDWCGADAVAGSVCPWSIRCPECRARPGAKCVRPSGHGAAKMHAARWEASEAMDAEAGIIYPGQLPLDYTLTT